MTRHLRHWLYLRWSFPLVILFLQGCVTFSSSASYEIDFDHTGWKAYARNDNNKQVIYTPDGNPVTNKYIGYSAYLGTNFTPDGDTSIVGFGVSENDCKDLRTQTIPLSDGSLEMMQGACYSYAISNINIFVKPWHQSIPFSHPISNLTFTDPWHTYSREHDQQKKENHALVPIVNYTRQFSSTESHPNYVLQYIGLASETNKQEIKSLLINAKLKLTT